MFPSLSIRSPDRFELKYVLNRSQYHALIAVLPDYMPFDRQADKQGNYLITSLYYDSPDYKCYWNKLDGHRFRRKVRVRVYGLERVTPETLCFVEIKQRINKTLQKKRVRLAYADAVALCESGELPTSASPGDQAVIEEIAYLHHMLDLQPACVVSYRRLAFVGGEYEPGLRVTFDTQLKCRAHDLSLTSLGYAENQFFLPPQQCILEVKANYRVPSWLANLISSHDCMLRRVSKYCTALEQAKLRLKRQQITF